MSNAKHTKGPWTQADRAIVTAHETHGYATWLANCAVGGLSEAEQLANAQLMHAAPELLEALQRIEKRIAYYASLADGEAPNIEQWSYTDQSGDVAFARAAIAKATGEQA